MKHGGGSMVLSIILGFLIAFLLNPLFTPLLSFSGWPPPEESSLCHIRSGFNIGFNDAWRTVQSLWSFYDQTRGNIFPELSVWCRFYSESIDNPIIIHIQSKTQVGWVKTHHQTQTEASKTLNQESVKGCNNSKYNKQGGIFRFCKLWTHDKTLQNRFWHTGV